jgi:hypothetical protein
LFMKENEKTKAVKTNSTRGFLIAARLFFTSGFSFAESLDNTGNRYYFTNLFYSTVQSDKEAEEVLKKNPNDPQVLEACGSYYFIKGSDLKSDEGIKKKYSEKALKVFDKLYKQNRSDRSKMLLAYAYASSAGLKGQNLLVVIGNVMKSRNLFSMAVASLPDNIDPRLGRTRINMNMPEGSNRPDDIILEDCDKFFEVYQKMPAELQENPMYKVGVSEMRLAACMVYDYRNNKTEAALYFKDIDRTVLNSVIVKFYDNLKKKYGV